jgi:excisionase family DNA binding protein
MRALTTTPARHTTRARPAARRALAAIPDHTPGGPRPGNDPLLTADQVAAMLQVTKAWVYAETRAGRIPHIPLGRYVRYRRSAVQQWITTLERQTPHRPHTPFERR